MAKTNREIRGDLADQYHDSLRKVEETLESLAKSGYSEEEIKETRENLISNLQNNLGKEEGYEESKKSHRVERDAKLSVIKAKKERERLKREYEEKMNGINSDIEEKEKIYKNARSHHSGELYGNKMEILEYLGDNCVDVSSVEYMGYEGRKICINLPKIRGKFDGFKFEFFVSNEYVNGKDLERNPKLEDKLYSIEDVCELLRAVNRYMQAMGVETDGYMDYENVLTKQYSKSSVAGECINRFCYLFDWIVLKDKVGHGAKTSRALWRCFDNLNIFQYIEDDLNREFILMLRLS